EQFSYLHNPRPLKNPNYTKNDNRRARNPKTGNAMDIDGKEEEIPTYSTIEAPPSLWPQKRYCDITGLEVCDFATGLRYHDRHVYAIIQNLVLSSTFLRWALMAFTEPKAGKGLSFR
ncbi:hypothetical protein BKA70DRAFT_1109012, partial [Coprinopsis sp. MPI-PUGE-AT-0042]